MLALFCSLWHCLPYPSGVISTTHHLDITITKSLTARYNPFGPHIPTFAPLFGKNPRRTLSARPGVYPGWPGMSRARGLTPEHQKPKESPHSAEKRGFRVSLV
ncbi:hypothetical protein B0H16DRAFT_1499454 [Mycena metata]|uniref:Uncharacterized protein n=1 Tax=Mycena metata TaxID=1033252 RepID=A0AAD7K9A8_9AGAR|nr:hypothetical protein B0H16DRAFT_1499454 [Mycena metata]